MAASVFRACVQQAVHDILGGASTDVGGVVHGRNDGVGWVLDGHDQGAQTYFEFLVDKRITVTSDGAECLLDWSKWWRCGSLLSPA